MRSRQRIDSMDIKLISEKMTEQELRAFLNNPFPDMIKFVADIEKKILALGGELHADAEAVLLDAGSEQKNLWGGNVYPDREDGDRLEYTSLINIRPSQNNRSLEVEHASVRERIQHIVSDLLPI